MISVLTIGSLYWSSALYPVSASYEQRDGVQQCTMWRLDSSSWCAWWSVNMFVNDLEMDCAQCALDFTLTNRPENFIFFCTQQRYKCTQQRFKYICKDNPILRAPFWMDEGRWINLTETESSLNVHSSEIHEFSVLFMRPKMFSCNGKSWANFHRDRTPIRRSVSKTTFRQSQCTIG